MSYLTLDMDATEVPTSVDGALANYKEAAKAVDEKKWKPLNVVNDAEGSPIVVQEWAEVTYVPSSLSTKKDGPDYRFLAIRGRWNWKAYKDAEDVEHAVAKQKCSVGKQLYISGAIEAIEKEDEGIRRLHLTEFGGHIYKLFGVASNIEDEEEGSIFGLPAGETMDGKAIIEWHRKRCSKSEEIHHSLKEELAGGHVPSMVFEANTAWWNVAVLAMNFNNILKNFFLPAIYHKSRPPTLRFLIYTMAGKIVSHGRRIVLKL